MRGYTVRSWFESLEERERLFVLAAAAMLVVALFYLAVWMPLDRGQENLESSVETRAAIPVRTARDIARPSASTRSRPSRRNADGSRSIG